MLHQIWEWFEPTGCKIWKFDRLKQCGFKQIVRKCQNWIWLQKNPSLQSNPASNKINVLKESKRQIGRPQKHELPQKDKRILAAKTAAINLFEEHGLDDIDIDDTHSKGFKCIQNALNNLSNSKYAPKILQKYNLGDSIIAYTTA